MKKLRYIAWMMLAGMLVTGCVPSSKFQKLKETTERKINDLKKETNQLEVANKELKYKT